MASFPMYFPKSAEELVAAYERDDQERCGLFVPTTRPAEMEDESTIETPSSAPKTLC